MFQVGDKVIWNDTGGLTKGIVVTHNQLYLTIRWENGRVLSYKKKNMPSEIEIDLEEVREDKLNELGI